MWQRFTEKSRQLVFAAQGEASRLNTVYINTEHLLLGMLSDEGNVACRILKRMGIEPQTVYAAVERKVSAGDAPPRKAGADMQLAPRAKRVIDLAYDEARQLSNNYIGTEHLLLGLIREGEGLAGQVLREQGVELERTRSEVRALQDNDAAQSAPAVPADAHPDLLSRLHRTTATGITATAAGILFDREFRKLSPEQQQTLQNDGLPLPQLPPVFYVILKVAMEAWNTQDGIVLDPAGVLRVQKAEQGSSFSYTAQTDVTLIASLLATDN